MLNGGSCMYRFVVIIGVKESQVVSVPSCIGRRCWRRRRGVSCVLSFSFNTWWSSSSSYLCHSCLDSIGNDSSNCLFVYGYGSGSWWSWSGWGCSDRWRVLLTNIGYYLGKASVTVCSIDESTNRSLEGSSVGSPIRWEGRWLCSGAFGWSSCSSSRRWLRARIVGCDVLEGKAYFVRYLV